jgi:hypothetical protein
MDKTCGFEGQLDLGCISKYSNGKFCAFASVPTTCGDWEEVSLSLH